jgi:hypothetical protein
MEAMRETKYQLNRIVIQQNQKINIALSEMGKMTEKDHEIKRKTY